jgi:hypothetical protein
MLEAIPDLKPHEAKLALIRTAVRLPNTSVDRQGWGMVHPRAAIFAALQIRGERQNNEPTASNGRPTKS